MTAFTSPVFALTITATSCRKPYRYRPALQNINAFLIPTFVRLCVVVVSEAAARAMFLAEESGIFPLSFFLVSSLCFFCQDSTQGSVVKMEERQKEGGNFWQRQSSICLLPSSLFSMAGSEEAAVLTWT